MTDIGSFFTVMNTSQGAMPHAGIKNSGQRSEERSPVSMIWSLARRHLSFHNRMVANTRRKL